MDIGDLPNDIKNRIFFYLRHPVGEIMNELIKKSYPENCDDSDTDTEGKK